MRRREFITLVGFSAVALPIGAWAQQTRKVWRVGMLETTSEPLNAANFTAFRRGLQQLGYVEAQNLINIARAKVSSSVSRTLRSSWSA
jgi:hypothetical protein